MNKVKLNQLIINSLEHLLSQGKVVEIKIEKNNVVIVELDRKVNIKSSING